MDDFLLVDLVVRPEPSLALLHLLARGRLPVLRRGAASLYAYAYRLPSLQRHPAYIPSRRSSADSGAPDLPHPPDARGNRRPGYGQPPPSPAPPYRCEGTTPPPPAPPPPAGALRSVPAPTGDGSAPYQPLVA